MNQFDERIQALQENLKRDGLKAYIIPATDPHMSEESAPRFTAERFYFCSFLGNDGTLLVTQDSSYLYTDGRYWTEAEGELEGTSCQLVRAGKPGVPSLAEFVRTNDLYPLGVDASLFSLGDLRSYYVDENHKIYQVSYRDMVENLPELPKEKIFKLADNLLSTTREERVDSAMAEVFARGAKSLVISTLDDIAYVLGYRGMDIACTPVFYSYLYIDESKTLHLFIDNEKLPEGFLEENVVVAPYDSFYDFLKENKDVPTFIDTKTTNARICAILTKKICGNNPTIRQKAVKGEVEINNTKEIQAIDGLAVLKLMKYVRDNIDSGTLDEYQCAQYIDEARISNDRCFDLSFTTIAAVDSNAAMMHYAPSKENHAPLTRDNQLLLVDSGGQYYGGTTDTTRTFLVNKTVSPEIKHDYTLTLKSQIALSTTIFEKGCSGHECDIKAREIMWKEGLDYKCGTGHGVGYISCVHEGPIGFRYYHREGVYDDGQLVPGHIITVEPGVYKDHKHGIRLENDLLVVPAFENDNGIFYKFETITYAPYDVRGIDKDMLTDGEIEWYNNYCHLVRAKLAPLCKSDEELLNFLFQVTTPIVR